LGARFSAPVQTGPGVHPASCAMGTGSFPGIKSGRGVTLTPHPLVVPWSRKGRAVPLLLYGPYGLYRTSVPVHGCNLPTFTLTGYRLVAKTVPSQKKTQKKRRDSISIPRAGLETLMPASELLKPVCALDISLFWDKSVTTLNLAFLIYWYRKKCLQKHF